MADEQEQTDKETSSASLDSEQIEVDLSQDAGEESNTTDEKAEEITAEDMERARISLTLSKGLHASITEDQCVEYYRRQSAFNKAKNIDQK